MHVLIVFACMHSMLNPTMKCTPSSISPFLHSGLIPLRVQLGPNEFVEEIFGDPVSVTSSAGWAASVYCDGCRDDDYHLPAGTRRAVSGKYMHCLENE